MLTDIFQVIALKKSISVAIRIYPFRGGTLVKLYNAIAFVALCSPSISLHAAENINYKYDAKGRLIEVKRTGTVNNNVTTTYNHDKADNRKNTTTTGSPNTPPP